MNWGTMMKSSATFRGLIILTVSLYKLFSANFAFAQNSETSIVIGSEQAFNNTYCKVKILSYITSDREITLNVERKFFSDRQLKKEITSDKKSSKKNERLLIMYAVTFDPSQSFINLLKIPDTIPDGKKAYTLKLSDAYQAVSNSFNINLHLTFIYITPNKKGNTQTTMLTLNIPEIKKDIVVEYQTPITPDIEPKSVEILKTPLPPPNKPEKSIGCKDSLVLVIGELNSLFEILFDEVNRKMIKPGDSVTYKTRFQTIDKQFYKLIPGLKDQGDAGRAIEDYSNLADAFINLYKQAFPSSKPPDSLKVSPNLLPDTDRRLERIAFIALVSVLGVGAATYAFLYFNKNKKT